MPRRRRWRVWGWGAAVFAALLLWPATAGAHQMPSSAVLLDIGAHQVDGTVEMPLGRLAFALEETITPTSAITSQRTMLEQYVRSHVHATGADGQTWAVTVGDTQTEVISGVQELVMSLALTPPDGVVSAFDLRYDVIIDRLATHRAFAVIHSDWNNGTIQHTSEAIGIFDWNTGSLRVDAGGGSWFRGFAAAVQLGVNHISTGVDHLLFLLMLLVPASLVVRSRRWHGSDDTRRSVIRVLHVVTAFAIGHSITLALATFGLVHPPAALIESLIAASILVSAIHALRPIVPGGEALIAGGFGLVHGLAFATLLGDLGLKGTNLVSLLLGFNLGIELTQILVVALIMPSLWVLSRTGLYATIRTCFALFGIVVSGGWLLNRTSLLSSDPFARLEALAISHPILIAASLAVFAACARVASSPHRATAMHSTNT
jgi:HupE / UreJ protein